jgi:hypothetical protein
MYSSMVDGFTVRFPDSGIFGLTRVCRYPKLIAAYHALHRLLAPRHPPFALISLTTKFVNIQFAI